MKKLLSGVILTTSLLATTPAHAVLGVGDQVFDAVTEAMSTVSASIDEAMEAVTKKWQAFMESTTGKTLTQVEETVKKVQGVTDKVQEVYDKTFAFMNDPKGAVITTVGLDAKKTEQMQYLPRTYGDTEVNNFEGGTGNNTINGFAEDTYQQIIDGRDDKFTLTSSYKGPFEAAVKDRDAKEAAYYLAMSEEAYRHASDRYDQINKDYESKIKNANEAKEKENLQMNLQAEQLLLQSQLIQLTALKQTHEARREVADQRKQVIQKMKKDMRRISVL